MKLFPISLAVVAAFMLAACSYVEAGRDYAGQGASRAVVTECSLSVEQRKANLKAVNDSLEELGEKARGTALDCNGDSAPDF